jgi:uncharacterized protein (DUF362 family)
MSNLTRRELLGAAAGAAASQRRLIAAPTAPVAVAKCQTYDTAVLGLLERMFDQVGGLGRLVKGKTVAVKLNMTGAPTYRMGHIPLGCAQWVHPEVIGATVHLLGKAGARRIRLVESPWSSAAPLEEYMLEAQWEPRDFLGAAPRVEFENTNFLGNAKTYSRLKVPTGGYMFSSYDVNHSYVDCDVYVTLAKLKESPSAGITLSIKNSFGILPATISGDGAGKDEPSKYPSGGRTMMHTGYRMPPGHKELDPTSPRNHGYRIPRTIVDIAGARPIDLAVIDGIESITVGPGPWQRGSRHVKPGVLVVGTNCVTTDAVATALMGFDPMSDRGTPPFEDRDNTMRLAEDVGIGTRDLKRIEVIGTQIRDAVYPFRLPTTQSKRG